MVLYNIDSDSSDSSDSGDSRDSSDSCDKKKFKTFCCCNITFFGKKIVMTKLVCHFFQGSTFCEKKYLKWNYLWNKKNVVLKKMKKNLKKILMNKIW